MLPPLTQFAAPPPLTQFAAPSPLSLNLLPLPPLTQFAPPPPYSLLKASQGEDSGQYVIRQQKVTPS